jgi:colicin import membrane protein
METEEKGLIIPEKINALEIYSEPGRVDPILEEITRKAKDFVPDTTTAKGRAEIKSMAYKVTQSKTYLDDLGKQLVAGWKEQAKAVDSSRKKIRDTLDELKNEVRKPLTDWEAEQERIKEEARLAEVARLEAEQARIKFEQDWNSAISENEMFDRRRELERKEKELEAQREEQRRKDEESRKERERMAREEQIRKEEAARLEKEKQEALTAAAQSRRKMLVEVGVDVEYEVLRSMPEQVWNEFYAAKVKEFQAEKLHSERIKREQEAKEHAERMERERKEAIELAEHEKQAAIEEEKRKEGERLDKMATARQEMLKEIGVDLDFHSCRTMNEEVWNSFYSNKNKEYQDEQQKIWIEKMKAEREEERLENERKEKERLEAERLAEEKRVSNVKHQNKIKNEASASMLSVLQKTFQTDFPLDKVSDLIVDSIAAGKITHLSIKF